MYYNQLLPSSHWDPPMVSNLPSRKYGFRTNGGQQRPGSSGAPPSGGESRRAPACTVTQGVKLHGEAHTATSEEVLVDAHWMVSDPADLLTRDGCCHAGNSVPCPTFPGHGPLCPVHTPTPVQPPLPPSRTQRCHAAPCRIA